MNSVVESETSKVLERILGAVSGEEFLSEYWQKRPLYIPGDRDKFSWLLDAAGVRELIGLRGMEILVYEENEEGKRARLPLGDRDPVALFEGGADLHLMDFQHLRPEWSRAMAELRAEVGHPGGVDFISICTQGTRPVDLHFDGRGVINIQLQGRKRWVAAPEVAVAWPAVPEYEGEQPPWHDELQEKKPDPAQLASFVMSPGDMVYVPSGLWHAVPEVVESPSISLLITFMPASATQLLHESLAEALHVHAAHRTMPAHGWRDPRYAEFLLDSVRQWANDLTAEELRYQLVRTMATAVRKEHDEEPELFVPEGASSGIFVHAIHEPPYLWPTNEGSVVFLQGEFEIEFDEPHLLRFARELTLHRRFTLEQAKSWVDVEFHSALQESLEQLVEAGVLAFI